MSDVIQRKKVIIVGAGVGGVATAARLSKAGLDVTVVEKNTFTGGRCSLIHDNGYRFDQGPSLLLLPQLFHSTFSELGTSLEAEGVHLFKCEPNYVVHFHDGNKIQLSTDISVMKREIEKWEGPAGFEKYLGFLQESHFHYEISLKHVLKKNFPSLFSLFRPGFFRHIIGLHPFDSVYTRASKWFHSDRLRRVFTFGTMYMGMSPLDAPGTYSLLQYTELAEGIWYPEGGFHKVVDALVEFSKKQGVHFRMETAVDKVDAFSGHDRRAKGVWLSTGEYLAADIVVVNADLTYAYQNLLPRSREPFVYKLLSHLPVVSQLLPPTPESLAKRKPSCSSISFYWSMDRIIPELHAHNVFLAEEYEDSFDEIFQGKRLPHDPSFYVHVPSRVDKSAAPSGKDALVVLVPTGSLSNDGKKGLAKDTARLEIEVEHARNTILKTLEARFGVKGFDKWISHEIVNTPLTWKEKFNLDRGAILGLAHNFFNIMSFRPRIRHANISSLYFVGASTHPGTGVPICLVGAKLTAEQVLRDLGMEWLPEEKESRQVPDLDKRRRGPLMTTIRFLFLFLASLVVQITIYVYH